MISDFIFHFNRRKVSFLAILFFLCIILVRLTVGQTRAMISNQYKTKIGKIEFAANEFILKFTEEASKDLSFGFENDIAVTGIESIDDLNKRFEVQSIERVFRPAGKYESHHEKFGLTRIYRFIYKNEVTPPGVCEEYKADPNLEYVHTNYKNELCDVFPNDPHFNEQWGLHNTGQTGGTPDADIDAPEAWQIEKGNSSIIIGIIDTGIDLDHPDLETNIWINTDEIPDNGIDDDGNGYIDDYYGYDVSDDDPDPDDYHGHGSHCAGIAAMVTDNNEGGAGTCWYCKVMAVKIFPNSYSDVCAEGIVYAADNGANVLSNSWGSYSPSSLILDALEYAQDARNCVTVFAAGKDNVQTPHYPAYYELNIAVAATDHNDKKAVFSNYGDWIDICAPGVNIFSCVIGGYDSWDGTSRATPFVAGVAGLVFSRHPDWTNDEVRTRIEDSADNIDLKNPGYEGLLGKGRLNGYRALLSTEIQIIDAYGAFGTIESMHIGLENEEIDVYGLQFTAKFDGSLLTATEAKKTDRTSAMTIVSTIGSDSIKVLLYGPGGEFISKGTGPIVEILFDVTESAPFGDSTLVHIKNAMLADENGDPIHVTTKDGWFHFTCRKGDINQDGMVDIFDLVKLINFILGIQTPTPYEFCAADINDDGVLDIFDVVKMINIILEGEPTTLAKMSVSPAQNGGLSLPDVALIPEQVTEVPIYATFDGTVAGVQLVLCYDPQSLKVSAPVLTSRTDQMELASVDKDGKLTMLIYSTSGNVIAAGSDPILKLQVEPLSGFKGSTGLKIDHAIAVNDKAEAISVNFSTGNIAAAKAQSYSLSQNYPNPFNSETRIKFELPEDMKVTIKVYNLRGEEVKTLVEKDMEVGYHSVIWDGRDNAGKSVSTGIYIYRMDAANFTSFHKMALLK